MLEAIFFDAVGTLVYLTHSVGYYYQKVAEEFGVTMNAQALDRAFKAAWAEAPPRSPGREARADDDKGWWRELVGSVLTRTLPSATIGSFDEASYFEAVYTHFAQPGVWAAYEDARPTLQTLRTRGLRLGLISNFDRRLYPILSDLQLAEFFDQIIISSEVGAEKPAPRIFETALSRLQVAAAEAMHVGDDLEKDGGAEAVGLRVFHLDRPAHGLSELLIHLD